eukprot:scaffold404756_cov20-Prasinocladus_malaysianus.AAC.1
MIPVIGAIVCYVLSFIPTAELVDGESAPHSDVLADARNTEVTATRSVHMYMGLHFTRSQQNS